MALLSQAHFTATDCVMPLARSLPPEMAHRTAVVATARGLMPKERRANDGALIVESLGKQLRSPLGVAAGFDKDAEAVDGLLSMGFSHVEVGTVTPLPQRGNPKPRVFRIPERGAIVNRLGFNSAGMEAVRPRLKAHWEALPRGCALGVNVGKNRWTEAGGAAEDYSACTQELAPYADYVAVNVSSPNTPGLRSLQSESQLREIVSAVKESLHSHSQSVFVKLSPDLTQDAIACAASSAIESGASGIIVSNTTQERPDGLGSHRVGKQSGGLSGSPLLSMATSALRSVREAVGSSPTLLGVGGVSSGAEAYEKVLSGASLVQLYTGLAYRGPSLVPGIKRELSEMLRFDGFSSLQECIGAGIK